MSHDVYDNPLIGRYASRDMSALWSPSILEQISRGALGFTQEDAEIMQARLRNLINTNETGAVVMEKVQPRP